MIKPILVDLNPDEYNPALCHYPFMVNLDELSGSCNTLDDLSCRKVPHKAEDVNDNFFI